MQNISFDRVEELHFALDNPHLRIIGHHGQRVVEKRAAQKFIIRIQKTHMGAAGLSDSGITGSTRPQVALGLHNAYAVVFHGQGGCDLQGLIRRMVVNDENLC